MVSIPVMARNSQEFPPVNSVLFPIVGGKRAATPDETDQPSPEDIAAYEAYQEVLRAELAMNWEQGYTQVPDAITRDPRLSPKAKIVYGALLSFMWFKTDRCFPSQKTLAEKTHYSLRTVVRALNELHWAGYIEKRRMGQGRTNYYFLNPLSFAATFRRTGREAAETTILPAGDQARRVDISTLPPAPDPALERLCQPDTSKDANVTLPEVPNWQTNHTKRNQTQQNSTDTYIRSAKGAEPKKEEFYTRPETIRSSEALHTETGTTREPEPASQEPKPETENPVASQEKPAAPAPKPPAQAAPPCPIYLEACIARLSERFGDLKPKSSRTRAAGLYQRARVAGCLDEYDFVGSTDSPELHWIAAAEAATVAKLQRPGEAGIRKIVDGKKVAMPYFFTCLQNLVEKAEEGQAAYEAALLELQAQAEEQPAPEREAEEPAYQPEQESPRQDGQTQAQEAEAQQPAPTTPAPAPQEPESLAQEPESLAQEPESLAQEPESLAQEPAYQGGGSYGYTVAYQPIQEPLDLRQINPVAAGVLARIRAKKQQRPGV